MNKGRPSIVSIRSAEVARDGNSPLKDYFRLGRHIRPDIKEGSLGTGFIIHASGLILTNYHVIAPPPRYRVAEGMIVQLSDQREFAARVIGKDKKTNVALLKILGEGPFLPLDLGNSETLDVGEWVMAVGNPFGLEETMTVGVVSGTGRVLGAGPYDHFIQTDAVIHAGNTGGPLFNLRGEVIGMNTTVGPSDIGIGFAIPISMVKKILPMLEKDGKVTRGWLGVMIQTLTRDLSEAFHLEKNQGALVTEVMKESPAEKAGILRGDVIVEFDEKVIHRMHDLPAYVADIPVGKTVPIALVRDGEALALNVTIRLLKED
ncbi:MAG: S1C family serine protease [Nitrospiria bacterium]